MSLAEPGVRAGLPFMSSDGPSMAYMLQRERLRQEEERIKAMHAANEEWERARKAQERQLQLEEIQQRESALAAALLQHEQDKQQLRMNLEREGDPRYVRSTVSTMSFHS